MRHCRIQSALAQKCGQSAALWQELHVEGFLEAAAIRVAVAGVMMRDRGDREIRFKRRLAGVGCCRTMLDSPIGNVRPETRLQEEIHEQHSSISTRCST